MRRRTTSISSGTSWSRRVRGGEDASGPIRTKMWATATAALVCFAIGTRTAQAAPFQVPAGFGNPGFATPWGINGGWPIQWWGNVGIGNDGYGNYGFGNIGFGNPGWGTVNWSAQPWMVQSWDIQGWNNIPLYMPYYDAFDY